MSYDEVYAQAHAWVAGVTGYAVGDVIPSWDTGPRPVPPYITIGVTSHDVPVYLTDDLILSWDGTDLKESQRGARTATLSIQGYGPTSGTALEKLVNTRRLTTTMALLPTMSIQSITGVSRTPVPLGSGVEVRYIVEATVVYSDTSTAEIVPHVKTIDVEMTTTGTTGDIVTDLEISTT